MTDPRKARTLGEAAMNPDGTYNAIKALSWLSDAINPGRGLPESEVQKIADEVMEKKRRDSDVGLPEDAGTAAEPRRGGSAGRQASANLILEPLMSNITITPEDREAAARAYYAWIGGNPVIPAKMRGGEVDDHSMIQAFARARLSGHQQGVAEERERSAGIAETEAADIARHAHMASDPWQAGRHAMASTIAEAIRTPKGEAA